MRAAGPSPPAPLPPPTPAPLPPPSAESRAAPSKAPRIAVRAASAIMVVGALVSALAVFLPWLSIDGDAKTGTGVFVTNDFELYDSPGSIVLLLASVLLGLAIALFVAGRVLAVAISAVVIATIASVVAIALVTIVSDTRALAGEGRLGVGVILLVPGAGLSLAGSIWATATRQRTSSR